MIRLLADSSKESERCQRVSTVPGVGPMVSTAGEWLRGLEARRHRHVAVVALANKLVRICWKVLTSGEGYRPYPITV